MSVSSEKQYIKMTETPIPKLILSLGLPTTISMLVTNIYNMADTYFVGKLWTSASGAVGIMFGLMAIIQAFGFMLGHGAGRVLNIFGDMLFMQGFNMGIYGVGLSWNNDCIGIYRLH